jgi:hypothetical protein
MNSYSNFNPYSTTSYGSNGPADGGGFYNGGLEELAELAVLMTTLAPEDSEALAALQRFVIAPTLVKRLS